MIELFFVPCPPLTVTISLFDTELAEGTGEDDDVVALMSLFLFMGLVVVRLLFVIADVTADTDDNGAVFGITVCALDTGRVVGLEGGGGKGRLGAEWSFAVVGGRCLLLTFCSSFPFLFKLLNVVLNTLLAEVDLTTDEEERTKGCKISCFVVWDLLRCCFLIKASISSLFWCRICITDWGMAGGIGNRRLTAL